MRAELGRASPFSSVVAANGHEISEDDEPDKDDGRARFSAKLDHEVDATVEALTRLETRLTRICGSNETGQPG